MDSIGFEDILGDGVQVLREKEFREAVSRFPWEDYREQEVLIRGCGAMVIPAWAYMVVATRLQPVARAIYFGDSTSPIPVWSRGG